MVDSSRLLNMASFWQHMFDMFSLLRRKHFYGISSKSWSSKRLNPCILFPPTDCNVTKTGSEEDNEDNYFECFQRCNRNIRNEDLCRCSLNSLKSKYFSFLLKHISKTNSKYSKLLQGNSGKFLKPANCPFIKNSILPTAFEDSSQFVLKLMVARLLKQKMIKPSIRVITFS